MKKIKKSDIILFTFILVFSFLICWQYITEHFAADTFRIVNIGYMEYAIKYSLTDGRIFMGLIGVLASIINIPIEVYTIILNILAIIVSCITIVILKNIVLKHKKIESRSGQIFLTIVCYYTIFNYTCLEHMYFVECFVMSLSVLFYMLSANKLMENNLKSYLYSTILLFLGLISYQGTISAFFMFVILFTILKQENFKGIEKSFIISLGIFLIGFLLNNACIVIIENIFNTTQIRGFSLNKILTNIMIIFVNIFQVLKITSYLFPKYLYLSFIIIISLISWIKLYNKKRIIAEQLIIIIFSIACAFIPSVINLTAFGSSRIRYSLGAMIGFIFIHLIVRTDLLEKKVVWNKILIAICILYGIINSANYIYLMGLNKQVNEIDRQNIYKIDQYISNYENKNNKIVKNICVIIMEGNVNKAYYEEMNCTYVGIAVSSIRTEWATQGIINYYTNRNLREKKATDTEIEEYKNKVNPNVGYMCINDTLYVSAYMY